MGTQAQPQNVVAIGNSGAAFEVDGSKGNYHTCTLTAACNATFANLRAGGTYVLDVVQGGAGTYKVAFPGGMRISGGISAATVKGVGERTIYVFSAPADGTGASLVAGGGGGAGGGGNFDYGNVTGARVLDGNDGTNWAATLTGNTTFTFANLVAGEKYSLFLTQDATGGRTVAFTGLNDSFVGGSEPVGAFGVQCDPGVTRLTTYTFAAEDATIVDLVGKVGGALSYDLGVPVANVSDEWRVFVNSFATQVLGIKQTSATALRLTAGSAAGAGAPVRDLTLQGLNGFWEAAGLLALYAQAGDLFADASTGIFHFRQASAPRATLTCDATNSVLACATGDALHMAYGAGNLLRISVDANGIGFFAQTPVARPNITGSRAANPALADLLTKLALLGLITDSTII